MGTIRFTDPKGAGMTSDRNDWGTPQWLFDDLDAVHHFTLDPCASHENHKCPKYYTDADDGLSKSWKGETVFCNPPYGKDIGKWVRKCYEESVHATVVMLIPARTDTSYFHDFIYGEADIEFLRGRLKFEVYGRESENSAPFPSMIVTFRRRKNRKD